MRTSSERPEKVRATVVHQRLSQDELSAVCGASATGGTGGGKVRFSEFTIKKTSDSSSAVLF